MMFQSKEGKLQVSHFETLKTRDVHDAVDISNHDLDFRCRSLFSNLCPINILYLNIDLDIEIHLKSSLNLFKNKK